MKKPPLGIIPKSIHQTERFSALCDAISRYWEAGFKIPIKWIEEHNELLQEPNNIEAGKELLDFLEWLQSEIIKNPIKKNRFWETIETEKRRLEFIDYYFGTKILFERKSKPMFPGDIAYRNINFYQ